MPPGCSRSRTAAYITRCAASIFWGNQTRHNAQPLAWASPSPSEAVHLFEAPHSYESAPQTAEPDGATADSGPRLRRRGSFFLGSMRLPDFVSPSSASPGGFQPECTVPVRRGRVRRKKKVCYKRWPPASCFNPLSRSPMVERYAPFGRQKSLTPRSTLYTLLTELQADCKYTLHACSQEW